MKKDKLIQKIVFTLITFFMILMVTSCGLVAQIPLDKPENIRVTDITEDHAIVIWNSVPNANDYEVEVIKVDGAERGGVYYPSDSHVEIDYLEWDEAYIVKITPRASGTIWDKYTFGESATASFRTKMPGVPEGEFTRPQNVKAEYNKSTKDFTVSWDKVDGAVFYEVKCEYYTISDYGVEQLLDDRIQVIAAPETSFVDTWINDKKLKEVRRAYYTVWARDAKFESEKNESKRIHVKIEK